MNAAASGEHAVIVVLVGRSQATSSRGLATRTAGLAHFVDFLEARRGGSSPSHRETPVGSVETTISSNSIGSHASITATIGSGSPRRPVTFFSPALRRRRPPRVAARLGQGHRAA